MENGVLDKVGGALQSFRPRNQREFVAMQIARRFSDTHRLARYILAAKDHPKRLMMEAARVALMRHELNRASLGDLFFEVLAEFDEQETGR